MVRERMGVGPLVSPPDSTGSGDHLPECLSQLILSTTYLEVSWQSSPHREHYGPTVSMGGAIVSSQEQGVLEGLSDVGAGAWASRSGFPKPARETSSVPRLEDPRSLRSPRVPMDNGSLS